MAKKRRTRPKCTILAVVQKNDPTRFRQRTVMAEKGKGRKNRPRNNNMDEFFDCVAHAA